MKLKAFFVSTVFVFMHWFSSRKCLPVSLIISYQMFTNLYRIVKMGKKKFIENEDGTTEVQETESEAPKDKKEKKEYRLRTLGANIKTSKKSFKEQFFMNYEDGLKLIKKMRGKGKGGQLVQKVMPRHISLPYHMSGKAAMEEACDWIAQNTVGKYRKE